MKGTTIIIGGICLFGGIILGHKFNTILGVSVFVLGLVLLIISIFMKDSENNDGM